MINPCCIFTYHEDSNEAVLAARAASMAGLFPVFVVEDLAKPISKDARQALEEINAIVIATEFPRPGNLRGIECISGMLQVFDRILRKTGATHLTKIDSDTILTSGSSIRFAVQKDYRLFGWSSPEYDFHGSTYVISKRHVEEMLGFINRWKGIPGLPNASVPEDIGIFRMALLMDSTELGVSAYDESGGFGSFWCFQPKTEFFPIYRKRFQSVSFGNRKDMDGKKVSRVESYLAMSDFVNFLEKWPTRSSSDLQLAV